MSLSSISKARGFQSRRVIGLVAIFWVFTANALPHFPENQIASQQELRVVIKQACPGMAGHPHTTVRPTPPPVRSSARIKLGASDSTLLNSFNMDSKPMNDRPTHPLKMVPGLQSEVVILETVNDTKGDHTKEDATKASPCTEEKRNRGEC